MPREVLPRGLRPVAGGASGATDLEQLWLEIAHRAWTSLVVVPVDEQRSSVALATALAEAGTRLSREPVSALKLDVDQDPVVLADLQQIFHRDRRKAELRVAAEDVRDGGDEQPAPSPKSAPASEPRTIVSIPPLADAPNGAGVAQAADAVIVMVTMGRTRLAAVRRTIEAVGRERVLGCCIVP